jgi:hypothetical protein
MVQWLSHYKQFRPGKLDALKESLKEMPDGSVGELV